MLLFGIVREIGFALGYPHNVLHAIYWFSELVRPVAQIFDR